MYGLVKHALDWLVGGTEFPYKPIMIINTSARASHGVAALREALRTMSGRIINEACLPIPLLSSELGKIGIMNDNEVSNVFIGGLNEFCIQIKNKQVSHE